MKLSYLTDLVADLAPIAEGARAEGSIDLFGLLSAARPVAIAALAKPRVEPVLVVVPHASTASDLARELPLWTSRNVVLFPALESLPYERVHLDRSVLAQREAVTREIRGGAFDVVVAPVRALLQPVRDASPAVAARMELTAGQTVSPEAITREWMAMGYTPASSVEDVGAFARRGGVLDIFPAGADAPVRIELFGNEIDSMRSFDPATQRSTGPLQSAVIGPIAAVADDTRRTAYDQLSKADTSGLNGEALTAWTADLERLAAGAPLEELAIFAAYLLQPSCSLIQMIPMAATAFVDQPDEVWDVVEQLSLQAAEVQSSMEAAGELPPGLPTALLSPDSIRADLSEHHIISLRPGSPSNDAGTDLTGLFSTARLYAGRIGQFVDDVVKHQSRKVVVASLQSERMAEALADHNAPVRTEENLTRVPEGVTLVPAPAAEGWRIPGLDLDFLTEHELFGRARSRIPRRTRTAREAFFTHYAPGDYVVHLEHGIGRFESVTRMKVEGVEREYAVVQYAGSDRVYVPTDQLERLTRYIGSGDIAPQLNKLGGGEWQRARTRARQAADEIARELVELYARRRSRPAHAYSPDSPWQRELEASFPYPETPDQARAVIDVKADMEEPRPMDRLVCADVGYGKTEVAVRAAFKAVLDGKQVAMLVPTTILAQQHLETFQERFAAFPVKVEALSRFRSRQEQQSILRRLAGGEVDVVIGTHRLLQKDVSFKNLGLLIVDEEQRFGVRHKEQLKKLRETIDVLTLTATPIPRTLHMGLVGIREISVIETPPEGRLPIRTYLQPYADRLVREAVIRELDRDGQVYIVHNRVATIEALADRVRRLVPEARIVVAHGQMDEAQLEKIMLGFAHHQADVLICSTIIENGLDIPNVNTIIVNNAHRLGLTQLYQLRGRVGRSESQAYAYLLYPPDVHMSRDAARRLEAVFEAQELGAGMSIALRDLEIRGVGNLLGAEQSGHATAIGFDLYTRMIGEAVERMRGIEVREPSPVSIDLPLSAYLPEDYVGSESERLSLYRRLASVDNRDSLESLMEEMKDRFGPLPLPVHNLVRSISLKLTAREAGVEAISLRPDYLTVRSDSAALFDRVALYRQYASEARISTNVLRILRSKLPDDWFAAIEEILAGMAQLRRRVTTGAAAGAS